MIPHQRAQYLFDLVSVDLVVSLNGNSPMEKQREWRVAVFPTPMSGVGCHFLFIFSFCNGKTQETHKQSNDFKTDLPETDPNNLRKAALPICTAMDSGSPVIETNSAAQLLGWGSNTPVG